MTWLDVGGNIASNNALCDGIYNSRCKRSRRCITFAEIKPTLSPPPSIHVTTSTPHIPTYKGREGYFNYDPNDFIYGPKNWNRITNNTEYLRYKELSDTQQRDLTNKCNMNIKQSPIDLCTNDVNSECHEHHQTRTRVSTTIYTYSLRYSF